MLCRSERSLRQMVIQHYHWPKEETEYLEGHQREESWQQTNLDTETSLDATLQNGPRAHLHIAIAHFRNAFGEKLSCKHSECLHCIIKRCVVVCKLWWSVTIIVWNVALYTNKKTASRQTIKSKTIWIIEIKARTEKTARRTSLSQTASTKTNLHDKEKWGSKWQRLEFHLPWKGRNRKETVVTQTSLHNGFSKERRPLLIPLGGNLQTVRLLVLPQNSNWQHRLSPNCVSSADCRVGKIKSNQAKQQV